MLLGALCVGGFAYMMSQAKGDVDPVVDAFQAKLDAKDYAGAYKSIHPTWQGLQSEEEFVAAFTRIEDVLGPLQSKSTTGMNFHTDDSGAQATLNYSAEYANGPATIEINLLKAEDQWKVAGYRVQSDRFK